MCPGHHGHLPGTSDSLDLPAAFFRLEPSLEWRRGPSAKVPNSVRLFACQGLEDGHVMCDSDGVHLCKNCHLTGLPTLGSLFILVLPGRGHLHVVVASEVSELRSQEGGSWVKRHPHPASDASRAFFPLTRIVCLWLSPVFFMAKIKWFLTKANHKTNIIQSFPGSS